MSLWLQVGLIVLVHVVVVLAYMKGWYAGSRHQFERGFERGLAAADAKRRQGPQCHL